MSKNLSLYFEKLTNLPPETVSAVHPSLITPLYLHGNLHSLFFAGPLLFVRHFSTKKNIAIVIAFSKHCLLGLSSPGCWGLRHSTLESRTLIEQKLKFRVKNDNELIMKLTGR